MTIRRRDVPASRSMQLFVLPVLTVLTVLVLSLAITSSGPAQTRPIGEYIFMGIGAHPDDDLLFMNPDLTNTIGAGNGTVTVMLTAAEADGGANGESKSAFAGMRQDGLRAAYAAMAGVADDWVRTTHWVTDHYVEEDILIAAPQITLLFINLPDGGDPAIPNSLLALYEDSTAVRYTFIPDGSTVTTPYGYTRDSLRQTLLDLMNDYQPSHLRMLDPQPALICGATDQYGNCTSWLLDDNPDHKSAGRFADLASQRYQGPWGTNLFSTFYYKGYAIADHRGNLSANNYTRKRSITDVYKQYDSNFRLYEDSYAGMFGATYERYPGGTIWLQPMADGRLAAFAVQERQVHAWVENVSTGTWTGPTSLGGGPVAPHIDVIRYGNGLLRLFALQIPVAGASDSPPGPQTGQRVITAVQTSANGPFGAWQDLGDPDGFVPPAWMHWTGMPVGAVNAAGYAEVFSRNAAGGVSRRVQGSGGWAPWEALPSVTYDDVVDNIAATRAVDGRIELFASYRSGDMAHWRQNADGSYGLDPAFPPINVASPPTVTYNQDGRLEVFYHLAGTADVTTCFFTPGGFWSTNLVDLGGDGGIGAIAAMLRTQSGQIMLFARNDYNGVSANWQGSPNSSFLPTWQDLGGEIPGIPSAANDVVGRVVLAAIGTDDRLYIRRETAPDVIGSFGPWTAVGADLDPTSGIAMQPDPGPASARPNLPIGVDGPNPTSGSTAIRYSIARPGLVLLEVFDLGGRRVADLVHEVQPSGAHTAIWDGRGPGGLRLARGMYLARLRADGKSGTLRLILAE